MNQHTLAEAMRTEARAVRARFRAENERQKIGATEPARPKPKKPNPRKGQSRIYTKSPEYMAKVLRRRLAILAFIAQRPCFQADAINAFPELPDHIVDNDIARMSGFGWIKGTRSAGIGSRNVYTITAAGREALEVGV